jgi:hypothetical protein
MNRLIFLLLILSSCGEPLPGDPFVEKQFFANELKLISSDINDPRDTSTFNQSEYTISSNRRLLVRLESMQSRTGNTVISRTKRMYMTVSSAALLSRSAELSASIRICPMKTNWMMLATWSRPHPFPTNSSRWSRSGGDFEEQECFSPDPSYPNAQADTLYFDISDWFVYQLQSRSINYGLIVTSTSEVTIYGDENLSKGPKFIWTEL